MKHQQWVNVKQTPQELAEEIGNLNYENLSSFLKLLSDKLKKDSKKDKKRGRYTLSGFLSEAGNSLLTASIDVEFAFDVCKPYMRNKNENK